MHAKSDRVVHSQISPVLISVLSFDPWLVCDMHKVKLEILDKRNRKVVKRRLDEQVTRLFANKCQTVSHKSGIKASHEVMKFRSRKSPQS